MLRFLIIVLLGSGVVLRAACQEPASKTDAPVAVFAELDGVWEGEFVGYDTTGVEIYRIVARHEYTTVDRHTQRVVLRDRMPDGTVITGEGQNTARPGKDGRLELRCVVEKSTGERVEHTGRLGRAPGGAAQITWSSRTEDRAEIFRELVRREGDELYYLIDGFGRYGGDTVLMAGRYRKLQAPLVIPR